MTFLPFPRLWTFRPSRRLSDSDMTRRFVLKLNGRRIARIEWVQPC